MNNLNSTQEEWKVIKAGHQESVLEAWTHIADCTGMIEILKRNPDFAITVKVCNVEIGLCNNEGFLALLESEIAECEKCIEGLPNKFD